MEDWTGTILLFAAFALFPSGISCLLAAKDKNHASTAPASFTVFYALLGFFAAMANLLIWAFFFAADSYQKDWFWYFCIFSSFVISPLISAFFGWRRGLRVKQKWLVSQP